MLLRAKAPLRVSFAGGGTDVSPFPEQEGGAVLSATIDRYAYGSLSSRSDGTIRIDSVDYGMSLDFPSGAVPALDGKLDLVKAVIRRFDPHGEHAGYDLVLHSNAPPGSGLGSSSTVMVALIGLLKERYQLPLGDYDVAQLAYSVEREDLGIRGGLQDQYAATFGGFNYIEFHGDHVLVNPLRVRDDIVNELEHNMLLCYTGVTRASTQIIEDQTARVLSGSAETLEGLRMQKDLALQMKNALLRGQLNRFGELLGEAWRYKKQMSSKISNSDIDAAYEVALQHGALGGKITGAGGGGYLLLYCDFARKHKVAQALTGHGISVTEFSFEPRGLTTWRATGE